MVWVVEYFDRFVVIGINTSMIGLNVDNAFCLSELCVILETIRRVTDFALEYSEFIES